MFILIFISKHKNLCTITEIFYYYHIFKEFEQLLKKNESKILRPIETKTAFVKLSGLQKYASVESGWTKKNRMVRRLIFQKQYVRNMFYII